MLLIAVVIAIGAFVVLSGGDDDEDDPPAQNTTAEQTRTADSTETNAIPKPEPKPKPAQIVIANGEVRGGDKRVEAKKGDTIRIDIRSDVADELHLHGYDVFEDVAPGRPARFRVKADIEGVFELEGHDSIHGTIANVVVEP